MMEELLRTAMEAASQRRLLGSANIPNPDDRPDRPIFPNTPPTTGMVSDPWKRQSDPNKKKSW